MAGLSEYCVLSKTEDCYMARRRCASTYIMVKAVSARTQVPVLQFWCLHGPLSSVSCSTCINILDVLVETEKSRRTPDNYQQP